jgi:hypothetical protein
VRDNGLTIPLDAVQQGPQGHYVFVVGADHKVEMQPVSVRETLNGQALIRQRLERRGDGCRARPIPADAGYRSVARQPKRPRCGAEPYPDKRGSPAMSLTTASCFAIVITRLVLVIHGFFDFRQVGDKGMDGRMKSGHEDRLR